MPDRGHELTDAELKKLERRIAREYKTAVKDMQVKLDKYLQQTEKQRQVQEALYKAGKITKEEYENWCYRHTMMGKRWEQMRDVLASDMTHANQVALGITKGKMPDIFALNANYATYQIEQSGRIDTGFTLYNHDTAAYLLGDQRQLMPKPSAKKAAEIAANKDMQWNMKKIQSAVLQGVLQGEPPEAVARRLMDVGQMNYSSAVRYARTMTTSAQNAGRYEAFHRAKRLGVDLTIEWQATLDSRTRHEHRQMHGQRREVDEPFNTPDGYSIMYPADCTGTSDAPQKEIWNCRCTLLAWVKGFERDTVKESPAMDGKTFEEWQNEKAPKNVEKKESTSPKEPDKNADELLKSLKVNNVEYRQVTKFEKQPTEQEIIDRVGGGDLTKGSCASLSFAYAGNKSGYDVLDFRGGNSWRFFSRTSNIDKISKLQGVESKMVEHINDFKACRELLESVKDGREYILSTGSHAAIIRKTQTGFEYLEMQSSIGNGWYELNENVLKRRFGCKKSHSTYGFKYESKNHLIDVDSLGNNSDFADILGYINTDPTKQKKGRSGYAK